MSLQVSGRYFLTDSTPSRMKIGSVAVLSLFEIIRPARQLKGFQRIAVAKGENKTISFLLKADELAYWDDKKDTYAIDPGEIMLMFGSSSDDIRLTKTVELK